MRAVIARQAQEAGRRVSSAKEWAELQARTNGRMADTEKYNSILYKRMNGTGELTETENVIFYVRYGVLTEFLRMNVILTYFAMATATTTVTATDTECWKSGITHYVVIISAGTLVPSSVNGDIAIQWGWSQNSNPLTDYDKTLHN